MDIWICFTPIITGNNFQGISTVNKGSNSITRRTSASHSRARWARSWNTSDTGRTIRFATPSATPLLDAMGFEKFLSLVEETQALLAAGYDPQLKTLQTIEVHGQEPVRASIVVLHGLGADGTDFLSFADELDPVSGFPNLNGLFVRAEPEEA